MEEFRIIPEYENYTVSSYGRVMSKAKSKNSAMKELSIIESTCGYGKVNLYSDKKMSTKLVHLLVARCFLNHTSEGKLIVVNHIDNNRLNNRVNNLEVVSARYNTSCHKHLSYDKTSSSVGVCWNKRLSKWIAAIKFNGVETHLGTFDLEEDAIQEYSRALTEVTLSNSLTVSTPASKRKSSVYKGVSRYKKNNKWTAQVTVNGKTTRLGYFNDELSAAEAVSNFNKLLECK